MERVMAATTLPTLLLGGDPAEGEEEKLFANWSNALKLPGVRGLVVGRSLLYPATGDVVSAIDAAAALVHPNL
jgi:DhnA family fructose-bisphosphate aldolase class Ia